MFANTIMQMEIVSAETAPDDRTYFYFDKYEELGEWFEADAGAMEDADAF